MSIWFWSPWASALVEWSVNNAAPGYCWGIAVTEHRQFAAVPELFGEQPDNKAPTVNVAAMQLENGEVLETKTVTAAVFDKWTRAEMALSCGVDLVLELPTAFAVRSAGYFASGSVQTLAATGVVQTLSCGVESQQIDVLQQLAQCKLFILHGQISLLYLPMNDICHWFWDLCLPQGLFSQQ